MMGLQVTVQLKKPGKKIAVRRLKRKKLPENQRVSSEESISFMAENFKTKVEN